LAAFHLDACAGPRTVAHVPGRASVAVVAGSARRLRLQRAPDCRIACPNGALIGRALERTSSHANARLASIALPADVSIVAARAIRLRLQKTLTRSRLTRRSLALVGGGALDGAPSHTHARLARVDLCALVSIVAGIAASQCTRPVRRRPG